jgi:putative ATP-dependent endonuclease of the OLD family
VAVIPVDGKGNLDRPYVICREFGIAVYLVFDGDANHPDNAKRDANVALQSLCGEQKPQDFPQTLVTQGYACFQQTFAKAIADEFGAERFIEVRDEVAAEFGWNTDRGKAAKNPTVLRVVIDRLYAEDKRSETLDSLIQTIAGLAVASKLGK